MNTISYHSSHSFTRKGHNSNRVFWARTTGMQNTQNRPAHFIPIGLFHECAPFT